MDILIHGITKKGGFKMIKYIIIGHIECSPLVYEVTATTEEQAKLYAGFMLAEKDVYKVEVKKSEQ